MIVLQNEYFCGEKMILKKVSGRQQKHGNFRILKVDPLKTARFLTKMTKCIFLSLRVGQNVHYQRIERLKIGFHSMYMLQ